MLVIWQNLCRGVQTVFRNPVYSSLFVLTLTLGIGSNIVIFSLVNAVFFASLPYENPDQIVMIWGSDAGAGSRNLKVSPMDLNDWQHLNHCFSQVEAFNTTSFNLTGVELPLRLAVQSVSGGFFQLLGAKAQMGRTLLPSESLFRGDRVVVLGHRFWKRSLGADPNIIGRILTLDGENFTVVGVMPPTFEFFDRQIEAWVPLRFDARILSLRHVRNLSVVARLKRGVTVQQAQSEMELITRRLERDYPASNSGYGSRIVPLRQQYYGDIQKPLRVLFGAVFAVLLISCANVVNLLLARTVTRLPEIAIRRALGAKTHQLISQFLLENAVLVTASALLGVALALLGISALDILAPANTGLQFPQDISLDVRGVIFIVTISAAIGLVLALMPIVQNSKMSLVESLSHGGRGIVENPRSRRFRFALVIAEVTIAVLLGTCANMMMRTFSKLKRINLGFEAENLLTMRVIPFGPKFEPYRVKSFYKELTERVESLPGVQSCGIVSFLPLTTDATVSVVVEGTTSEERGAHYRIVNGPYFRTMGIPLLKGRLFEESDTAASRSEVIINQTMARQFWPGEDPIGKRLRRAYAKAPWLSVIGVVGDVCPRGPKQSDNELYWSFLQLPIPPMSLAIKTRSDPLSLVSSVRNEISKIDKDLPVFEISTMKDIFLNSMWRPRFSTLLLSLFSALAMILTFAGIYAVIAYTVTQRSHEIRIRIALGADRFDVFKLILKQGLKLIVAGVLMGLVCATVASRIVANLMDGLETKDPYSYALASFSVVIISILACFVPALRATRSDPNVLRYQ